MRRDDLEAALRATFDDRDLSRSERRALGEVLGDVAADADTLAWLRSRAFAIAREAIRRPDAPAALDWLEEVSRVVANAAPASAPPTSSAAYFAPGDDCPRRLATLFDRARRAVDVCVFTITDDRIVAAMEAAHARGVRLRVVTDDDKAFDLGSDVERLGQLGVPVRVDRSPAHMHHKFALFDDVTLVTGSYNWTRGAAAENRENLVVTDERSLIAAFRIEFDRLWDAFAG